MTDISAKEFFYDEVKTIFDNCNDRSVLLSEEKYKSLVKEVQLAQNARKNKESLTSKDYRRLKRYDIMIMNEKEKLIKKRSTDSAPIIYYCSFSKLYDALKKAHIDVGHKRTRVMEAELRKKYCNITREVIDVFLSTCEQCQLKKLIKESEVSADKSISLRSSSTLSSGSKQGFVYCKRKRYCTDKKCSGRNFNVKCNSKCHSSSICKNK